MVERRMLKRRGMKKNRFLFIIWSGFYVKDVPNLIWLPLRH